MKTLIAALALLSLATGPVFAAGSLSFQQAQHSGNYQPKLAQFAQLQDCYLNNAFIWVSCT
jgi:hypothetical protein